MSRIRDIFICIVVVVVVVGCFYQGRRSQWQLEAGTAKIQTNKTSVLKEHVQEIAYATAQPVTNSSDPIVEISLSTDYDKRSKFQKKQIKKYCSRHHWPDDRFYKERLYQQLIYDEEQKVMFCLVEKNGNTNIKRLFLVKKGFLPEDTLSMVRVNDDKLGKALNKISVKNDVIVRDKSQYYKAMMVRNPLDRLESGYRDKMRGSLKKKTSFPHNIHRDIMKKYHNDDYQKWLNDTTLIYHVSFSDFIKYVIDTPNDQLNVHFRPMINLCQPCTVKYDFYGAFKNYNNDTKYIIDRLQTKEEYRYDKPEHPFVTEQYLNYYYSQLSQDLKERLFRDWYNELEFYYHLYPEERHSHKTLLNIDEDIPIDLTDVSF